jgi:hypothetical protein
MAVAQSASEAVPVRGARTLAVMLLAAWLRGDGVQAQGPHIW